MNKFLLVLIIILAAFLRFYKLGEVPVSLYWDEVAQGYNSYSILKTGKDEYGNFLPLLFRSFEDYKMPGYIYLSTIPIWLFGLNEFSTRFMSAFLGTLTVLVTYWLVKELTGKLVSGSWKLDKEIGNKKLDQSNNKNISLQFLASSLQSQYLTSNLPLLTSFLLAISPWHLQFSRAAYEANAAHFFVVLGAWLFLKSLKSQQYFVLSIFSFTISFFFYRSIFIFLPLFLTGMFWIFRKEIMPLLKLKVVFVLYISFLIIGFMTVVLSFGEASIRAKQVSVFNSSWDLLRESTTKIAQNNNSLWARIIYNRRLVYSRVIIANYLSHFSPLFLFVPRTENSRHQTIHTSILYPWESLTIIVGLIFLLKTKSKMGFFLLWWWLTAPVAAAFNLPSPHELRSFNILPTPQIISAFGLVTLIQYTKNRWSAIFSSIIIAIFVLSFLHNYFGEKRVLQSFRWADGYKQLVTYLIKKEANYEKIIVSGYFWKPYIYFLFYQVVDPEFFQKNGSESGFGKYIFGKTSWGGDEKRLEPDLEKENFEELAKTNKYIAALSEEEFVYQYNVVNKLTEIRDQTGKSVFIIAIPK